MLPGVWIVITGWPIVQEAFCIGGVDNRARGVVGSSDAEACSAGG